MGHTQTTRETAESLERCADRLRTVAKQLEHLAEEMHLSGVSGPISVRHGPGLAAALRDTIEPFVADARVKVGRAVEAAKKKSRR